MHVRGSPTLSEAAEHLVSEPDGVLVVDDGGGIVYSGAYTRMVRAPSISRSVSATSTQGSRRISW
jgi:guanine deaminase